MSNAFEKYALGSKFSANGLGAFLAKVRSALQLELDTNSTLDKSPDELGIDSLVAVDLQSWFRRELDLEIAVMKILSTPSFGDLLSTVDDMLREVVAPETEHIHPPLPARYTMDQISESKTDIQLAKPQPSHATFQLTATPPSIPDTNLSDDSGTGSDLEVCSTVPTEVTSARVLSTSHSGSHSGSHSAFERTVPMSFAQSGFWFLRHLVDDLAAFNVTTLLCLKGNIDLGRFKWAVDLVGKRYEALRTAFFTEEVTRKHLQGILAVPTLCLEHVILDENSKLEDEVREMQEYAFDLSKGETVRIKLVSVSDGIQYIVQCYHHIAMDGISLGIFLSDLEKAYQGTLKMDTEMVQYPDFAVRQLRDRDQGIWSGRLDFWREYFADVPSTLPILPLSYKTTRPDRLSFTSHLAKRNIESELKTKITHLCRKLKVKPHHFYLAVFGILLFRHTNSTIEELCIGVTDGNRKEVDTLRGIGLFLNLLPLRLKFNGATSFADHLSKTKAASDEAFYNSGIPIDVLLDELKVPRSLSHNPLFQTLFNYRPNIGDARTFCGCEANGEMVSGGKHSYDIAIDILDSNNNRNIVEIAVNSEIYTPTDAQILLRSYLHLLECFARSPTAQVDSPSLYLDDDVQAAILLGRGWSTLFTCILVKFIS